MDTKARAQSDLHANQAEGMGAKEVDLRSSALVDAGIPDDHAPPRWLLAMAALAAAAFFQLMLLLPCAVVMAFPIFFYGANTTVLVWGGLGFQPDWRSALKTLPAMVSTRQ